MIVTGNKTNYGFDIGVLMLDTIFPRIIGDIGNAKTFDFPVRYKIVPKAIPTKVVIDNDPSLIDPFINAARELETEGVKAITTSCGFLAVFQQVLSEAVAVPVFTSSLLQVPMIERMLGSKQKIVIVTAHGGKLGTKQLAGAGIADINHIIMGLEDRQEFYSTFVVQKATLDVKKLKQEMEDTAFEIKNNYKNVGAIVFECTNLPPFREIFQDIVGVPVFDIVTLTNYVHASLNKNDLI